MSRMPRVLQVVLSLNPGGTERLVIELVRRLHPDLPMAVCCLDDEGSWAGELTVAGVEVRALRRPAGFAPGLGRAVATMAARHGATVLHCHHYSPYIYGSLARMWGRKLKMVYTEHGRLSDAPPSAKRRAANVVFGRFPSAVFAVSGDLRDHMVAEGFSPNRVGVIYNGIDPGPVPGSAERMAIRGQLNVPENTLVIGTVARLDPVKDLGTLIKATALMPAPALLVVIGDGSEADALKQQAVSAGIADRVRFLGLRNDARTWLAGCDVYANSSISEGVSLTILEAMAAGLPVVATRVGGTPEVLDSSSGVLVPSRDPQSFSKALTQLQMDPARRKTMGCAARQRLDAHFTIERMVSEYRHVYERLA